MFVCLLVFLKRGIQKALRTLFFDFFFFRGAMIFPPRLICRHDSFPIVCFFFFSLPGILFFIRSLCVYLLCRHGHVDACVMLYDQLKCLEMMGFFFSTASAISSRHLSFFFPVDSSSFLKSDVRNDSIMAHNEHTTTNTSAFSRLFCFLFQTSYPDPIACECQLIRLAIYMYIHLSVFLAGGVVVFGDKCGVSFPNVTTARHRDVRSIRRYSQR